MAKHLVIVESPAKAKTINRYIGKSYLVKASMGHVRDLPKERLGVDVSHDFNPEYKILPEKKRIVRDLQNSAGKCEDILLAADPDREGEAICWHLAAVLESFNKNIFRAIFNEITEKAVKEAFENLKMLDQNMFNAQQTRRILDRLVGYNISPLLWKKIGRGLSAGRVQSVALKLICEREKEIKDFIPEEYWSVTALLHASFPPSFRASLVKIGGKKVKIKDGKRAEEIKEELRALPFILENVEIKEKKKSPSPPYITSTLQQDSFRFLRFPVKKTMAVAQRLYEGIEIRNKGLIGLITYMRTDSLRISDEALSKSRRYIQESYPKAYLPQRPRVYRNKRKAQDAHEAIRPTSFDLSPEKVKPFLGKDEHNLYSMIWNRFLTSQMSSALIEETEFDIRAEEYQLKARGEVIKFDGFLVLYPRKKEDEGLLPKAEMGEKLRLLDIETRQNFTQPPPRYTEGSLVKELETKGIGRPSTYAPIIMTLQGRDYVIKEKGKFIPTELGIFVTDYLDKNFPDLMEFKFTARLEEELDRISEGEQDWLDYLRSYYSLLHKDLEEARKREGVKGKGIPLEETCPKCGRGLVIREGRYGRFRACSGFPECKYRESLAKKEAKPLEETCPDCGSQLVIRKGRYGNFVACSNYPHCRYIKSEREDTGITCPEGCGGTIIKRKTRKGKVFFGCSNYPKCQFATWDEPLAKPCPECDREFILRKNVLKGKPYLYCSDEKCGYKEISEPRKIWEKVDE